MSVAEQWPLSEVASTLDARPRDVILAAKALGFSAHRLNEKVNREQALEIRRHLETQRGKQEKKLRIWTQKQESNLRAAAKRQELEKKCEEDRSKNRASRDPKIPSQKNERNKNIAGFTLRSEEVRLAEEERALIRAKHLEEKRHAQRGRAKDRQPANKKQQQPSKNNAKLTGQELISFCINAYENDINETSQCIRTGYSVDNIGQFRRAFSRAADVPFGPLSRMIADLKQKEALAKERVRRYLDDQNKIIMEEPSAPLEEGSDEIITERRTVEVRSTTRIRNTRFRNAVLKAHGYKCACCGIDIPELLEAAHIVPVANDGTDHPSNGIALCPTHHSAFDRHYFTFEPGSRKLILKEGITTNQLHISSKLLGTDVNDECLALRQRLFNAGIKD